MQNFFEKLLYDETTRKMREYAKSKKVPIIQDEGLSFLLEFIHSNQYNRILEIGTAIGYSAIAFASLDDCIKVDSIERNFEMIIKAKEYVSLSKKEKQIRLFESDAMDMSLEALLPTYDFIFIDAAKAQYINFFLKYQHLLSANGSIVADNIDFHGLVESNIDSLSKNKKRLVMKIREFIAFLEKQSDFQTTFYKIGDGISISRRLQHD